MERPLLVKARKGRFWTLAEAAERLGVEWSTLQRWEKGTSSPQPVNLERLCSVYAMTPEELGFETSEACQPFVHVATFPMILTFIREDLTAHIMDMISNWPYSQYHQLQSKLLTLLEEYSMDTHSITRRTTLQRLLALSFTALGLTAANPTLPHFSEETLKQCATGITACWELSKSDHAHDVHMAFEGVSAYLPLLKTAVRDSSQYRKAAASLAGQGALLQTLLAWHLQGLKEAARYAQEAVQYSREADDVPMLLATLDYLAWVYYYDKRGRQALDTIEQAIPLLKQKQPLPSRLLGGVHSTIALMRSKNGQSGIPSLRQAAQSFFSGKEEENRFVYMDYTRADLVLNDGMVHYQQGEYDKALDSLSQLIDPESLNVKMILPERSRIEGLNVMTLASLKQEKKDKEQTLHFWHAAVKGAKALQSEQRFDEAVAAYDIMEAIWPHEKDVKAVKPLAVHW